MLKEIFASIILGMFYPDGSWLNELTSMDHMVEYNTINLSQIGGIIEGEINNSEWPLASDQRSDNGISIPLATYDTYPTHVTNVEELETAYDKCQSVVKQHADTLRTMACKAAAYNIAPSSNTDETPIVVTTGPATDDGASSMSYNDILTLRTKFNKQNYPMDGRVILLSPEHEEQLLREDVDRYNRMMTTGNLAGFKVYTFNGLPTYGDGFIKSEHGMGNIASIAFCKSEVMRAMGTITGEPEKRWADYRGWLIGFQMRFIAKPFRDRGIGAIVTVSLK